MATAYHRDQPGAPGLSYGFSASAGFNALKAVLKACLVTGYGVLPAAGWELISEGVNHLVLRSGTHSGYVGFTLVGSVIRVYLAETYLGMSGDIMQGDGLKTGTAAGNAVPQAIAAPYLAIGLNSTTWSLVADDRTFVLNMPGAASTLVGSYSGSAFSFGMILYAGEDADGGFICIGGDNTTATNQTGAAAYFSPALGFTTLRDPATGLLVDTGGVAARSPTLNNSKGALNPQGFGFPAPHVDFSEIVWTTTTAHGGRLRGICVAATLAYLWRASVCVALSVAVLNSRTISTPVDLGDGAIWFIVAAADNETPVLMMTTQEEFW